MLRAPDRSEGIYGLGSPDDYENMIVSLRPGMIKDRDQVIRELIDIQYTRNDMEMEHGCRNVLQCCVHLTGQRVRLHNPVYLVAKKFNADQIISGRTSISKCCAKPDFVRESRTIPGI